MTEFFHFVAPFNVTYELFQLIRFNILPTPKKVSLQNGAFHLKNIDFSPDMIKEVTEVWYEFTCETNEKNILLKEKMSIASDAITKKDYVEMSWESIIEQEKKDELLEHVFKEYIIIDWGKIDGLNQHPINTIQKAIKKRGTYYREHVKAFEKIEITGLPNAVYIKGSNSGHFFLSPIPPNTNLY